MARLREKPAGQVTPPRKPKKSRAGPPKPDNSLRNRSMNGFDDSMDHGSNGTKPMQSTPRVTMSQTTAGASRQLTTPQVTQPAVATHTLHRTISRTPSAVEFEDPDSSFSETADRILSPRVNRIEELRTIYRQIRDEYEKTIKDVNSYIPSTHEEDMALRQYLLHCELVLAKAKLNLDIAISYATTEYGRSNTTDIPRLAITKGWLEESLRRIDIDTPTLETDYGHLFSELSHYFLATIITQHQHSIFERRRLPTTQEIADIFQRTEPRSYVPGVGPFLELATGLDIDDPLLMPELLRRLEARIITDMSLKDRDNPHINRSLIEERSQLEHQSAEPGNDHADGTVPEVDANLDAPSPGRYMSAELEIDPLLDAPSPASISSYEADMLDAPSWARQPTSEMEIDPALLDAPSPAISSPAARQDYQYQNENRVEENVEPQSLAENSPSSCEPKLEDEQEIGRPAIIVGEQIVIDGQIDKTEYRSPELGKIPAQVKLDVEMDHQDGTVEHTAEPRPFYMIRDEATGLDENDHRDLSVISDFSTYDEVMQDVQEVEEDEQPVASTIPTISQTISATEHLVAPTPSRFYIHDSFVISDDETEPDSNPYLAAYREKLASASASTANTPASSAPVVCLSDIAGHAVPRASTSNTPASSAPVVCLPDVTRRAIPRKSEPVVLVSSPARPDSTQPPPTSISQRQSSRISDSMFISDDSDDDIPPSSNPHLTALIRAKASASAHSPAPVSGSSTPTSSASTIRSTRTKLPPHLARVRRAAHRQSLDPSSQVPTPEEKQLLDQEEYPLIDIIDEKTVDGEKKYLIKWKPIHGRNFMNTWEPAENANAASVEDWELQKTRREKRMDKGKVKKKNRRGTGRERREKSVREAAAAPASQRLLTQRQLAPSSSSSSSPADSPMFVVDTVGDTSLASRGTRFVPALYTPPSSPAGSHADQVSSRTRSKVVTRDEPLDTPAERIPDLTSKPAFDKSSGYVIKPFFISAVSPAPQPVPASSSRPNNSDKYKTPAQQKARMREKRAIRRAEKAEKLANMTEKQRAEHEHSKMMHKKAKRERKRTKAERWAAMSEEERQYWENWWDWKRAVRARTKEIKKERKAKKARRKEKEARRKARKEQRAEMAS